MSVTPQTVQQPAPATTPLAYVRIPKVALNQREVSQTTGPTVVKVPQVKKDQNSEDEDNKDYTQLVENLLNCDRQKGECNQYFQEAKQIDSRDRMGFLFDVTKVAVSMKSNGDNRGDELSDKIQNVETLWGQQYLDNKKNN
ncbi:hypothetical protein TRICI_005463 [Trichomonascus ciferrii]|uniref:Uncharacterized protein n=1 Tax=Trichomonascus ciferrii TaxID=44093 RepID=A0A642USD3_9ASCO|nr:hypothetical protein TRICI_005463 [Trichomonascus ciferrii]